ncbi:MAG: lysophospholipid acyltransferase family protein [Phycisphaerales bacterium]
MPDDERWHYSPARDLGLRGLDRLASTRRETGLAGALGSEACARALHAYLRGVHRLRVSGREHVPADPPGLIVANHASHLDALVILAALPAGRRRATYVISAADRFFTSPARAGAAAGLINAIALRRGGTGRHELGHLRERLAHEPCRLIVFPEGTRSRSGEMGAFRDGVGSLVAATAVPVTPCFLTGTHAAMPPGARVPRPRRIACAFGPPLTFADTPSTREGWREIAAALRQVVTNLGAHAGLDPLASTLE